MRKEKNVKIAEIPEKDWLQKNFITEDNTMKTEKQLLSYLSAAIYCTNLNYIELINKPKELKYQRKMSGETTGAVLWRS